MQLHGLKGTGLDTWSILKKLACDKNIVDTLKKGKGINSLKVFDGYILEHL